MLRLYGHKENTVSTERKYEIYNEQFRRQAHAVYARMRAEDPVLQQPGIDGETPIWFVTRYAEVEQVLLDDKTFVRDPGLISEEMAEKYGFPDKAVEAMMFNHMLNRDGTAAWARRWPGWRRRSPCGP